MLNYVWVFLFFVCITVNGQILKQGTCFSNLGHVIADISRNGTQIKKNNRNGHDYIQQFRVNGFAFD